MSRVTLLPPSGSSTAPTVLLGPQRFTQNVGGALAGLEVDGPVAVINPGWEEREDDDGELDTAVGGRAHNLRLYHRMFDVIGKDKRFAAAALQFRDRHDELLDFYRIRLSHALSAVQACQRRTSRRGVGALAEVDAIDTLRAIDGWYLEQLTVIYADFDERSSRDDSELIGWHRGEIQATLDESSAVVLPGGHVGVLLRALRLFEVRLPPHRPVVAWSAGAMALTDAVVLFHDFSPQGTGAAEVHGPGLGRLPGLICLPHARRRLDLDDHARMRALARRFPAHELVLLDDGTSLSIPAAASAGGRRTQLPSGARTLTADGTVREVARVA